MFSMKKLFLSLLSFVIVAACTNEVDIVSPDNGSSTTEEEKPTEEDPPSNPEVEFINFPDATFKAYLLNNFDSNSDGEISPEEALLATEITVTTDNIETLKGIEYFLNQIFSTDKTGGFDLTSREKFVETAQPTIQYAMKLYMNNSDKLPKVIESVKSDFSKILLWISSKESFYSAIKETFDAAGVEYDNPVNLKKHCELLYDAVNPVNQQGSLSAVVMGKILPLVAGGNQDFQRIIKMHSHEVTCVTLIKYLGSL